MMQSPLNDAQFALNEPVELRFTKPFDVSYYLVYAYPDGGVDLQHSPVIKELRDANVAEFSTVFQVNDPRTYNAGVQIGSAFPCDPPSGQNNRFTVLPDPSAVPTPTPTPVVDPQATPAIKLDSYNVSGGASVADRAISIQPMTIRNEGSVPLEIYDIKPYGYAPELIVLPDGFVPCTVIQPGGSLTVLLLATGDFEELAKLWQISVTLLVISNDPDAPSYSGEVPNEIDCYATRVRVSVGVSLDTLVLVPGPTPVPYVPPAPCAVATPTPTPSAAVGSNWNLLVDGHPSSLRDSGATAQTHRP